MAVLSFFAEVIDEALPERDPQETVFRLLVSVLEQTTAAQSDTVQPWMALTYFSLWMTRLMGLLPDMAHCMACGEALHGAEVSYSSATDGFFCGLQWPRRRGQDLRRFTVQALERHLERRLKSAEALGRLGG